MTVVVILEKVLQSTWYFKHIIWCSGITVSWVWLMWVGDIFCVMSKLSFLSKPTPTELS